jgi:hypothetical protein
MTESTHKPAEAAEASDDCAARAARPSLLSIVLLPRVAGTHPATVARISATRLSLDISQWEIVPCLLVSMSASSPVLKRNADIFLVRKVRACGSITSSP